MLLWSLDSRVHVPKFDLHASEGSPTICIFPGWKRLKFSASRKIQGNQGWLVTLLLKDLKYIQNRPLKFPVPSPICSSRSIPHLGKWTHHHLGFFFPSLPTVQWLIISFWFYIQNILWIGLSLSISKAIMLVQTTHFIFPFPLFPPIIYSSHSNQKDLFDVNHITSLSHFQQLNSFPITSTTLKGMVSEPPVFLIDHAILCSSPQTQECQVHASSPFKVFIFAVPSA